MGSDALPFTVAVYPGISPSKAALKRFALFVLPGFPGSPHDDGEVATENADIHFPILRGGVGVGVILDLGQEIGLAHDLAPRRHAAIVVREIGLGDRRIVGHE